MENIKYKCEQLADWCNTDFVNAHISEACPVASIDVEAYCPFCIAECDEVTAEMWEEKIEQLNLWSEYGLSGMLTR